MIQSLVLSTTSCRPMRPRTVFLFYDVDHQFDAIRYSTVYIPDLFFMTDKKGASFFLRSTSILCPRTNPFCGWKFAGTAVVDRISLLTARSSP